jgi:hypothetical protein
MFASAEPLPGPLPELCCVDPAHVPIVWPHVSGAIHRAMMRGGMGRFVDVQEDLRVANANLWLAIEGNAVLAVAVTKVTAGESERVCTIVACAGRRWPRFGALIEGLENYARAEDCGAVEICGRPGWLRRLKDYRLVKAVIRKSL